MPAPGAPGRRHEPAARTPISHRKRSTIMPETTPTVVLVHGAFADAASFAAVVPELLGHGLPVAVPAVPNRSLTGDAAYIASAIAQIDGPVILVGHSYGGAVITVAGIEPNVQALVYLSAYCLEEGESLGELQGRFPDSPLAAGLVYKTYPIDGADTPGTDVYVDVAKFPAIFAADVDPELARILAAGQRPLAGVAFTEKATAAAWKTKPAWGSVAINDHTINPDVERFGYQRASMTTIEIESSHLVMLSHPKEVTDLIHAAIAGS
jgi:pimeloyl-ACP methyl ester carboxylesterase